MNMRKLLVVLLFVLTPAAYAESPIVDETGVIQSIDYGENRSVISGATYSFAIDVKVQIGGSFGAMTMLSPGMKLEFTYLLHEDRLPEVTEVIQLPDSYPLEEY
jgi:hypothetical protein